MQSITNFYTAIVQVKASMDQLEKVMNTTVMPNEVKDALAFASKHPENSDGRYQDLTAPFTPTHRRAHVTPPADH